MSINPESSLWKQGFPGEIMIIPVFKGFLSETWIPDIKVLYSLMER